MYFYKDVRSTYTYRYKGVYIYMSITYRFTYKV